jgi:hypothetical protein
VQTCFLVSPRFGDVDLIEPWSVQPGFWRSALAIVAEMAMIVAVSKCYLEKLGDSMWIFTQSGFISAVRHDAEPETVVVRARDRESLEALAGATGEQVRKSPVNDYPYRVHVSENEFRQWLTGCVESMDYTNFKNRVHETRGDHFASVLMDVWEIMHEVEDDDSRTL